MSSLPEFNPDDISEDLKDSLGAEYINKDAESLLKEFMLKESPALESEASDLVSSNPNSEAASDLVFSASEGHIYYTAFEYYKELAKAARKYNKFICAQTRKKLSGKRMLRNPQRGIKWSATFNPFIYELKLTTPIFVNPDDIVPSDTQRLTYTVQAETNEEAHIRMATHLGFSQVQRDAVAQKFHFATMEKIRNNSKYLQSVRMTDVAQEHIKQIKEADYVPVDRRKVWLREIDEKIQSLKQELES